MDIAAGLDLHPRPLIAVLLKWNRWLLQANSIIDDSAALRRSLRALLEQEAGSKICVERRRMDERVLKKLLNFIRT
jgi:hypothetical protein